MLIISNEIQTQNHLVHKQTLNHVAKLIKWFSCVVSTYLDGAFDFMLLSVTYNFQSDSTLYSLPEWQETPCAISEVLSDSNEIQTHNHLVCTWTLKHLAKLAKWLSCVLSTYLYSGFDCMLLSCHVQVLEWLCTL